MITTLQVPEDHCPHCNTILDGATGTGKCINPGAAAICYECAKLSIVGADLKLRLPTEEESNRMKLDPRIMSLQISVAGLIKKD
jgi:hypothetical protein